MVVVSLFIMTNKQKWLDLQLTDLQTDRKLRKQTLICLEIFYQNDIKSHRFTHCYLHL